MIVNAHHANVGTSDTGSAVAGQGWGLGALQLRVPEGARLVLVLAVTLSAAGIRVHRHTHHAPKFITSLVPFILV